MISRITLIYNNHGIVIIQIAISIHHYENLLEPSAATNNFHNNIKYSKIIYYL